MHSLASQRSQKSGYWNCTWSAKPAGACTFPPISRASWWVTSNSPSKGMAGQPQRSISASCNGTPRARQSSTMRSISGMASLSL